VLNDPLELVAPVGELVREDPFGVVDGELVAADRDCEDDEDGGAFTE
jgi:hypothetical protein